VRDGKKREVRSQSKPTLTHKEEMLMFRLKHSVKLMGVVMMSGLLVWLSAGYPVVSQVSPMPRRGDIVRGLQNLSQTLTASEGDIWDIENAAFYSDPGVFSLAFIPLHPSSRSMQLIFQLIEGEDVGPVPFGVLYLEGDWPDPDLPLKAGTYILKLRSDRTIIAVAEDGEFQICSGYWESKPAPVFLTPVPPITQFSFTYQPEQAPIPGIPGPVLERLNLITALLIISTIATVVGAVAAVIGAICSCKK
jgi:hypothetical protein